MTVSRVVNKCGNVKKETEERVLKAIRELSYVPNAAARALNNKKTYNIGIVLPKKEYLLTAPFYIELLLSVEKHLRMEGYSLFLGSLHDETSDYSDLYKEGKVDGLIVFAPPQDQPFLQKLADEGIPFTVVLGRSDDNIFSYVDVNNYRSASTVIKYLKGLNHSRIGFVSGNTQEINASDRLNGYRDELENHGIKYDEELVYFGDWSLECGYKAFNHLYGIEDPPTAIFCANDYMAMGVIKAAQDRKLQLPEDLSVVGFDDLQYSSFITPSLTTVRQPVEQLAVEAAEMIITAVQDKDAANYNTILESELIIRNSCRALT